MKDKVTEGQENRQGMLNSLQQGLAVGRPEITDKRRPRSQALCKCLQMCVPRHLCMHNEETKDDLGRQQKMEQEGLLSFLSGLHSPRNLLYRLDGPR